MSGSGGYHLMGKFILRSKLFLGWLMVYLKDTWEGNVSSYCYFLFVKKKRVSEFWKVEKFPGKYSVYSFTLPSYVISQEV